MAPQAFETMEFAPENCSGHPSVKKIVFASAGNSSKGR